MPGRTMVFHVSGRALTAAELLMCTRGGCNPRSASMASASLEALHLARGVFGIQHFRRCEVRAHAFQAQVLARCEFVAKLRQRFDRDAQAIHSGVYLQMNGEDGLLLTRRFFQTFDVPTFPNRGREIVGDDTVFFTLPDSCHQQDARPDSGAAERAAFGGVGHTEPGGAFCFKSESAFGCAVAVSVGFHNRADRHVRADMLLHGAEVLAQGAQRNLRPSASIERQRAAIGQD